MAIEWQQNNRSTSGSNDIARLHSDDLNSTSSTESGQKDLSLDVSIFMEICLCKLKFVFRTWIEKEVEQHFQVDNCLNWSKSL